MSNLEIQAYDAIDENNKTCWIVIAPGRNRVFSNFDNFKSYLKMLEKDNYIISEDVRNWILKVVNNHLDEITVQSGLGGL